MAYERERLAEYVSLPGASAGALCHSQSAQSATMGTDLDEHTRTMFEPTSPSYSLNSFDEGPAYALADELCCDIEPAMVSNLTPTPHIATRDLKAMGLAAGGKLGMSMHRIHQPAMLMKADRVILQSKTSIVTLIRRASGTQQHPDLCMCTFSTPCHGKR